jgi:D-threo-aldose 1-dehydrogenase
MTGIHRRKIGRSGLAVTDLGLGGSPLGNRASPISEGQADDIVQRAWEAGIRYFDTAPLYGHGLAEARLGHSLRWKPREQFVISSKVGRILKPAPRQTIDFHPWADGLPFTCHFDYSYDGTMRSFEDSLQRLALERIDIAFIHDVDVFTHGAAQQRVVFRQAMEGAYRALIKLRDQGLVAAIGVGVNEWQPCHEALKQGDFDCFLLAGRYTLLEQDSLDEFLPLCEMRGAVVIAGGGLNSGILATGAITGAKYNYGTAPENIMEKVRRMELICKHHGVPLPAAALQFLLAHPAIASHIPGMRTIQQISQITGWLNHPIPLDLWEEFRAQRLLREDAPVPA